MMSSCLHQLFPDGVCSTTSAFLDQFACSTTNGLGEWGDQQVEWGPTGKPHIGSCHSWSWLAQDVLALSGIVAVLIYMEIH